MIVPPPQTTALAEPCCESTSPGKRERNRLERRAAIVAVARQLFLDQGYAATTMSSVAEAMGGSKATLWAHFASKEALFAEVADAMVGGFAEQMDELLGGQTFSVPGLRDFCGRFFEQLLLPESTSLFRMIIAESGRFPELGEMFFARGPQLTIARLERYLGDAFAPAEASRLAGVTLSALVGFRTQAMIEPRHAEPRALAAFVDDLIACLRLE
jgi:AcrR family transcriptional regulator